MFQTSHTLYHKLLLVLVSFLYARCENAKGTKHARLDSLLLPHLARKKKKFIIIIKNTPYSLLASKRFIL